MSPGVMGPLGVFPIGVPAGGVLGDILADAAKREFVADDVFVIVALPDGGAWGAPQFIDPACGEGFELADDFRQAVRRSCRGRFGTCPYGTRPHRTRPYHNRNGTGTRCRPRTRDGTGTCGGTGTRCCCRGGFRTRPYRTRPYRTGARGGTGIRGGTGTRGGIGIHGGTGTHHRTGGFGTRPDNPRAVGDNNDAMYMVGHDHKGIQLHIGYMIG